MQTESKETSQQRVEETLVIQIIEKAIVNNNNPPLNPQPPPLGLNIIGKMVNTLNSVMLLPLYEECEDLERNKFICEIIWKTMDQKDQDNQIAEFGSSVRGRALTQYINLDIDGNVCTKDQITKQSLHFKRQGNHHPIAKKLKEI